MEKTDRELLIKEISSRLPYGIKVQVFGWDEEKGEVAVPLKVYSINTDGYISLEYNHYGVETIYVEYCLLYLRPMSSMTEVEKHIFDTMTRGYTVHQQATLFDWLNTHHFDYRGLIEKGLAIEVTKDNNPYKE